MPRSAQPRQRQAAYLGPSDAASSPKSLLRRHIRLTGGSAGTTKSGFAPQFSGRRPIREREFLMTGNHVDATGASGRPAIPQNWYVVRMTG
jgi:hypothetical protein